jgi:hypothetical protein
MSVATYVKFDIFACHIRQGNQKELNGQRHSGSFAAVRWRLFSYLEVVFSPARLSQFASRFRAIRIRLRRLILPPLHARLALSACVFVILRSGQSWETRALVMPSLLASSEREYALPSLNCLAQV